MKSMQAVDALGALAQETRLNLFRLLVQRGADGLSAGVIAERLGVPPSSLTFHLHQLLRAGLVSQRRVGRQIFYAAEYGSMNALLGYLTENCCGRDASVVAACNPATPSSKGAQDEAPARARQRR
jgi:ArsR family transcriptional regulator, arsenate/arsenite/antimonite-responsive transcriptional repressor